MPRGPGRGEWPDPADCRNRDVAGTRLGYDLVRDVRPKRADVGVGGLRYFPAPPGGLAMKKLAIAITLAVLGSWSSSLVA